MAHKTHRAARGKVASNKSLPNAWNYNVDDASGSRIIYKLY